MSSGFGFVSAFDGARVDGSWLEVVTEFARGTSWMNAAVEWWTGAGLVVFAILMVLGWWRARRRDAAVMAGALAVPVAVCVAFAVAEVVKKVVAEPRPCWSSLHAFIIETCPAPDDYAFPSGHATVAAATVGALCVVDRRLAVAATVFAVLEGFTRVYVGAHYPHDVLGSFVLALPIAWAVCVLARRIGTGPVSRLRAGVLAPVLGARPTRAGSQLAVEPDDARAAHASGPQPSESSA
ncbi:phosphatase PAP2 family protein [Nocardia nova]|uniref:phosphatase PAP2 family protein n=1 Tax=Nocardia nova TaxID=37330 RepID=UPI0037AC7D0D